MVNYKYPKFKNLANYLKISKIDDTNINEVISMFFVLPHRHTDETKNTHCFCGRPLTYYYYIINKNNGDILIAGGVCKDTFYNLSFKNRYQDDIWFNNYFKQNFSSGLFIKITDWDKYVKECIVKYIRDIDNKIEIDKLLQTYKYNEFIYNTIISTRQILETQKIMYNKKIEEEKQKKEKRLKKIQEENDQKQLEIIKEKQRKKEQLKKQEELNLEEKKSWDLYCKKETINAFLVKRKCKLDEMHKKEKNEKKISEHPNRVVDFIVTKAFCEKNFINKYCVKQLFKNNYKNGRYFIQSCNKSFNGLCQGNASDYTDTIYTYYLTDLDVNFIKKYYKLS
jgi:hypothetical protein